MEPNLGNGRLMRTVRCSNCKMVVEKKDNPFYPLCSERCRIIDLGDWLGGKFKISSDRCVPDDFDLENRGS